MLTATWPGSSGATKRGRGASGRSYRKSTAMRAWAAAGAVAAAVRAFKESLPTSDDLANGMADAVQLNGHSYMDGVSRPEGAMACVTDANGYVDMIVRCDALRVWQETLKTPFSLWMPGLFNPTAFLTGIKQVTARLHPLAAGREVRLADGGGGRRVREECPAGRARS